MPINEVVHTVVHEGEIEVQRRAGVHERSAAVMAQVVRRQMPDQHREFFALLPTLMVAGLDAQDQPWATMLTGQPGFITSPDAQTLRVAALPARGDPLAEALHAGAPLGLLGLEPHTRRRNRTNGVMLTADKSGFTLGVQQSFGNCPQYIQARDVVGVDAPVSTSAIALGPALDEPARQRIARADTLFIASASPRSREQGGAQGVDVSHRGGKPGFVRVDLDADADGVTLTLPDFAGNKFFNTLGNLHAEPRAGLLLVDAASGGVLQLAASAALVWDGPELAAFAGAQRLLKLRVHGGWWREAAVPLRWGQPRFAAQLAATGDWPGHASAG